MRNVKNAVNESANFCTGKLFKYICSYRDLIHCLNYCDFCSQCVIESVFASLSLAFSAAMIQHECSHSFSAIMLELNSSLNRNSGFVICPSHGATEIWSVYICTVWYRSSVCISRGDIHQKFANFVREMFTDVQLPVRQGWGWGQGEDASLLLPPPPYPAVYVTVHLYSSRTLFANCW
jgi:hypothetical protein